MPRFYDSPEELQADLNGGFDLQIEIDCPRCGYQDCEIMQMPDPKTWMGRIGKARCDHCGVTFQIKAIDEG